MAFTIWDIVSTCVGGVIGLLVLYQILYIIIGLFVKIRYPDAKQDHTYGIIICGRNEQTVIGQLIDSIRKQNYPQDKLRIFVVADNCDPEDATAAIARDMGCDVFERHDPEHVGKSFALDFIFHGITRDFPDYAPDGWFVFDADNLLDPDFIKEMNKCFDAGNKIITSYRDSKNFGTNMWTMGAAVHFIRECRFVHAPRTKLGVSTHVSGTGFLVSSDVLRIQDGWKYRRMTEDVEFSIDSIAHDEKIAYCDAAVFYDEQPTTCRQTFRQRMRWQKGSYQVAIGYTGTMLKKLFTTGKFVFYDLIVYFPTSLIMSLWLVFSFVVGTVMAGFYAAPGGAVEVVKAVAQNIGVSIVTYYLGLFAYGSLAVIKDWKRIKAPKGKKLGAIFCYPLFMICLVPVVFMAIFTKVKWKPIVHTDNVSIETLILNGSDDATEAKEPQTNEPEPISDGEVEAIPEETTGATGEAVLDSEQKPDAEDKAE